MTDPTLASSVYPTVFGLPEAAAAKYSPASKSTSTYESESSPLAAHSSTTASSSRLSGSYEPSQVGSYMDEQLSQLHLGESSLQHPSNQRPQLPNLILPSNIGLATTQARPVQAPYSNYHSYPSTYYPGSPVVREQYPYSPIHEQHVAMPTPYFPTPMSPPPMPAYPHPQMARRGSYGVYYGGYEYAPSPPVQSPVTPYASYTQPTSMMYMPPTPTQTYPSQVSPAPVHARQTRPAVSSPLRPPLGSASTHGAASTSNTNGQRRPNGTLYSSASSFGHQASLLYRRAATDSHGTSTTPRSAVLNDFKNQKFKRFELKDVFGHVVEFSVDQHGSRFIQQKLDVATADERQVVFDEIVPTGQSLRLMKDVFGNYVIQKLFEYGTTIQKALLIGIIQGNVLQLSLDMYGCRVIQKAVECTLPAQQSTIVRELDGHVLQLVKDSNGNHVIQKLLERVVPERPTFINAFSDNVFNLATHPYGCRVLQRCFEHSSAEQVAPLLEELHQNSAALMQDQFGNYVIQFVLERGAAHDRNRLIDALTGQLAVMSRHKFASNVCEKAMAVADPTRRRRIVEEMLAPTSTGLNLVSVMMRDQYANYVLQKAINLVDGELLDSVISVVIPQLIAMRKSPTTSSSKQLSSIERLLREKGIVIEQQLVGLSPPHSQDESTAGSPTP